MKSRRLSSAFLFCSLLVYGGPDGELGASLRYLSQRYAMPYAELKGLLTDIGTEGPSMHTRFRLSAA